MLVESENMKEGDKSLLQTRINELKNENEELKKEKEGELVCFKSLLCTQAATDKGKRPFWGGGFIYERVML